MYHDVARLEVTIHESAVSGLTDKIGKAAELCFQSGLVEYDGSLGFHKIVLEVVQIVHHRRFVKARHGIHLAVVETLMAFHLEAHQLFKALLEELLGPTAVAASDKIPLDIVKKGLVPEIRLKIFVALASAEGTLARERKEKTGFFLLLFSRLFVPLQPE